MPSRTTAPLALALVHASDLARIAPNSDRQRKPRTAPSRPSDTPGSGERIRVRGDTSRRPWLPDRGAVRLHDNSRNRRLSLGGNARQERHVTFGTQKEAPTSHASRRGASGPFTSGIVHQGERASVRSSGAARSRSHDPPANHPYIRQSTPFEPKLDRVVAHECCLVPIPRWVSPTVLVRRSVETPRDRARTLALI